MTTSVPLGMVRFVPGKDYNFDLFARYDLNLWRSRETPGWFDSLLQVSPKYRRFGGTKILNSFLMSFRNGLSLDHRCCNILHLVVCSLSCTGDCFQGMGDASSVSRATPCPGISIPRWSSSSAWSHSQIPLHLPLPFQRHHRSLAAASSELLGWLPGTDFNKLKIYPVLIDDYFSLLLMHPKMTRLRVIFHH